MKRFFIERWRAVRLIAAIVITSGIAGLASSQALDTQQMLSIFNNLPADQQQQIIQQLGGGSLGAALGGVGSGATGANGANADAAQPSNGSNAAAARRAAAEGEQSTSQSATLSPGDTVLVEIDLQAERRVTRSNAGLTPSAQLQAQSQTGAVPTSSDTQVIPAPALTDAERQQLDQLMDLIRARNPYTLDRNGMLLLPGFTGIALAGLTDELAARRVGAEPALRNISIRLTKLPLLKMGDSALKPYGYDLFNVNSPSTFAPLNDVPVPADYVVGPGDVLSVQLYGSQNRTSRLTVSRDGNVSFPELGPITVGGRSFTAVRNDIEARVARQMIGVRASVTMGNTRSIQVFVLGEAKYPGSYTVSGLSTITSALYASGGVKTTGSLRNIELKRQGRTVRQFDLYDMLLRGDTSNDASLLPGDAIFIPSVGPTVSIDGEVRRPAIYELKGESTASALIATAGGFTTDADTSRAALTRVNEQRQRVVVDVDPAAAQALRNGDALRVMRLRPTLDSGIALQGEVFRPGNFAWRQGLRLTDVIPSVGELKPNADARYLLIRRELPPDRRIAVVSADLTAALANPASAANVELGANDRITVFDGGLGRERVIQPLMDEIRLQANLSAPAQVVNASGRVKVPGDYPLEVGMRISDLIRAGGGLEDAAYGGRAELSRYLVENGQARRAQVIDIDLAAVLRGDPAANLLLQPFDGLYIKEISGWSDQEQVVLRGEVRFPGTYPIKRGESLQSVIQRAGGLTDLAFAEGAVFTRQELKQREQEQLDRLTERMRNDLATSALTSARGNQVGASQSFTIAQSLLEQLRAARAVGRLVIDLPLTMAAKPGSTQDVNLRNGDQLIVPKRRQEVTVIGEVQNVTSHLYAEGRSRDDYVALSGGTTKQADRGRTYIVRANGSVVANGNLWFLSGGSAPIHTGDTIVVPLDTERMPALPFWQSVTSIIYNLAISAAAVNSF